MRALARCGVIYSPWPWASSLGYTGDGKRTRRKVSGQAKAAVIDKLRDLRRIGVRD
jgi:hypothetical protein